MNLSLIEKLKKTEYELFNDTGNKEQVKEVVKLMAPDDVNVPDGHGSYYWVYDGMWYATNFESGRITIKLSEIYAEQFESSESKAYGEMINGNCETNQWQPKNGEMVLPTKGEFIQEAINILHRDDFPKYKLPEREIFIRGFEECYKWLSRPARVTLTVQEVADKFNIDPTRLNKELK